MIGIKPESAEAQLPAGRAPEIELLLCCARTEIDENKASRVRELAEGSLDWEGLCGQALRHRLLPLLYWNLNRVMRKRVPVE